ncbi:hypothetical protein C8F04DRAFT_1276047 [Mycena alexandri]|uniref:Uncharacterized protein n=1 Tax=Mycena alexandri TaxID=1745969 RepID=A0AAD6S325_9AGAR|nr:hypothetical protein C8F04DRAFT_1276047 [Mycena alexandri]
MSQPKKFVGDVAALPFDVLMGEHPWRPLAYSTTSRVLLTEDPELLLAARSCHAGTPSLEATPRYLTLMNSVRVYLPAPPPFLVSHYLNDRDHARARPPSTPASSRYRPLLIPTAYQLLFLHPTVLHCAIIRSVYQQPSIFLVFSPFHTPFSFSFVAGSEERARIVDAICACGGKMIIHRNWPIQRCLEAATRPEEPRKFVVCMRGRIVDLTTNYRGALKDPTGAANLRLARLSCRSKQNLEESAEDVDDLLGLGAAVFGEISILIIIDEHGLEKHRQMPLEHLLTGLFEFATNKQGSKSVVSALKEGGKQTLDRVVQRMCELVKGAGHAMILIASVLRMADKDQRAAL